MYKLEVLKKSQRDGFFKAIKLKNTYENRQKEKRILQKTLKELKS